MRTGAACTAVLAMAACVHRPVPVHDAAAFTPPAIYRDWWHDVERCAGRRADFEQVRWFVVPGLFVIVNERLYSGFWFRTHRIVIPEKRLEDVQTVKHEMLHVILQQTHRDDFDEGCTSARS